MKLSFEFVFPPLVLSYNYNKTETKTSCPFFHVILSIYLFFRFFETQSNQNLSTRNQKKNDDDERRLFLFYFFLCIARSRSYDDIKPPHSIILLFYILFVPRKEKKLFTLFDSFKRGKRFEKNRQNYKKKYIIKTYSKLIFLK